MYGGPPKCAPYSKANKEVGLNTPKTHVCIGRQRQALLMRQDWEPSK